MYFPTLGDAVPRRGNWITRTLGKAIMIVMGWKFGGDTRFPNLSKFVLIIAPHTSNWDFMVGLGVGLTLGLKAHWIAKDTLFRPPFGWVLRWLGGIPLDRSTHHGLVAWAIELFKQRDRLVVVLMPEGTRKRVDHWKTGFYYIAQGAQVPVYPAYFDYAHKIAGFGPPFIPSGDLEGDMARLRAFYAQHKGKHPTQQDLE